jgi:hypothetical protein
LRCCHVPHYQAFGDQYDEVREAAHGASKIIMGKLTATGVKLMMPSLLKGLQEPQWRSKQASILLLGSMAYCAPSQLSSCLPQIVPKLCECFTDTHPKIQSASREALQVGVVVDSCCRVAALTLHAVDDRRRGVAVCAGHRQRGSQPRDRGAVRGSVGCAC